MKNEPQNQTATKCYRRDSSYRHGRNPIVISQSCSTDNLVRCNEMAREILEEGHER